MFQWIIKNFKVIPKIVIINSNQPSFYPYSVLVNKCSNSCNNINDPYAKLCFPDVVKNMNIKMFNLMSRTNETRRIEWHETCECKCKFGASVCNDKEHWNIECRLNNEWMNKSTSAIQMWM